MLPFKQTSETSRRGKDQLREDWQRHADQLHPFWLLAYAPHLNLIERLWRYLKAQLASHRW